MVAKIRTFCWVIGTVVDTAVILALTFLKLKFKQNGRRGSNI